MTDGGTLRDQQAEFTRHVLMEAAQRVIDNYPIDEFSVQKVAEEAGVSHRTIYRYFPSRQELLDAFTDWMEDTVAPIRPIVPVNPDQIGDMVRQAFDRFDRHAPYFRASLMLAHRGETLQPYRRKERDEMVRVALQEVMEPLDDAQAQQAYAVIRYLLGIQTWQEMRDRFGLEDGEAGEAVAWAVAVLVDALRDGRGPSGKRRDFQSDPGVDRPGPNGNNEGGAS